MDGTTFEKMREEIASNRFPVSEVKIPHYLGLFIGIEAAYTACNQVTNDHTANLRVLQQTKDNFHMLWFYASAFTPEEEMWNTAYEYINSLLKKHGVTNGDI